MSEENKAESYSNILFCLFVMLFAIWVTLTSINTKLKDLVDKQESQQSKKVGE